MAAPRPQGGLLFVLEERNPTMKAIGFALRQGLVLGIMLCASYPADCGALGGDRPQQITTTEFRKLLQTVADGWNEGNARRAADCFTENAFYSEPPAKQLYIGRESLYEFFGGDKKPEPPMKMVWHHLAFDEKEQIGFGEYTFQMNNRYHGIVIVKVENGKIRNWREYQYKSGLDWREFQGKNEF